MIHATATVPFTPRANPLPALTDRQVEVMVLIAEDFCVKEIASKLNLSPKTVEHHRTTIYSRTGCHSAVALTRWAIARGYVLLPKVL